MFLTVMSASYTLRGFAQDARGAINDVLDSFTLPVFGGFMLGGIILGLIQQWDNIIDKENRGTRKGRICRTGLVCRLCIAGRSRGVRRKECHFRYQPVDMRYRIRKGLESPCMIRGLLSGDYWIFVGCCSAAFVLFFLGIRAGISAGNWNLPVLVLVISLPTLPLLLYKLKRKARPQKFKETGKEINISNLDINRVLTKKEHNEIRRGIQHT